MLPKCVVIISLVILYTEGFIYKCGDQITVKKGEKRSITFWGEEGELLKTDPEKPIENQGNVVSSSGIEFLSGKTDASKIDSSISQKKPKIEVSLLEQLSGSLASSKPEVSNEEAVKTPVQEFVKNADHVPEAKPTDTEDINPENIAQTKIKISEETFKDVPTITSGHEVLRPSGLKKASKSPTIEIDPSTKITDKISESSQIPTLESADKEILKIIEELENLAARDPVLKATKDKEEHIASLELMKNDVPMVEEPAIINSDFNADNDETHLFTADIIDNKFETESQPDAVFADEVIQMDSDVVTKNENAISKGSVLKDTIPVSIEDESLKSIENTEDQVLSSQLSQTTNYKSNEDKTQVDSYAENTNEKTGIVSSLKTVKIELIPEEEDSVLADDHDLDVPVIYDDTDIQTAIDRLTAQLQHEQSDKQSIAINLGILENLKNLVGSNKTQQKDAIVDTHNIQEKSEVEPEKLDTTPVLNSKESTDSENNRQSSIVLPTLKAQDRIDQQMMTEFSINFNDQGNEYLESTTMKMSTNVQEDTASDVNEADELIEIETTTAMPELSKDFHDVSQHETSKGSPISEEEEPHSIKDDDVHGGLVTKENIQDKTSGGNEEVVTTTEVSREKMETTIKSLVAREELLHKSEDSSLLISTKPESTEVDLAPLEEIASFTEDFTTPKANTENLLLTDTFINNDNNGDSVVVKTAKNSVNNSKEGNSSSKTEENTTSLPNYYPMPEEFPPIIEETTVYDKITTSEKSEVTTEQYIIPGGDLAFEIGTRGAIHPTVDSQAELFEERNPLQNVRLRGEPIIGLNKHPGDPDFQQDFQETLNTKEKVSHGEIVIPSDLIAFLNKEKFSLQNNRHTVKEESHNFVKDNTKTIQSPSTEMELSSSNTEIPSLNNEFIFETQNNISITKTYSNTTEVPMSTDDIEALDFVEIDSVQDKIEMESLSLNTTTEQSLSEQPVIPEDLTTGSTDSQTQLFGYTTISPVLEDATEKLTITASSMLIDGMSNFDAMEEIKDVIISELPHAKEDHNVVLNEPGSKVVIHTPHTDEKSDVDRITIKPESQKVMVSQEQKHSRSPISEMDNQNQPFTVSKEASTSHEKKPSGAIPEEGLQLGNGNVITKKASNSTLKQFTENLENETEFNDTTETITEVPSIEFSTKEDGKEFVEMLPGLTILSEDETELVNKEDELLSSTDVPSLVTEVINEMPENNDLHNINLSHVKEDIMDISKNEETVHAEKTDESNLTDKNLPVHNTEEPFDPHLELTTTSPMTSDIIESNSSDTNSAYDQSDQENEKESDTDEFDSFFTDDINPLVSLFSNLQTPNQYPDQNAGKENIDPISDFLAPPTSLRIPDGLNDPQIISILKDTIKPAGQLSSFESRREDYEEAELNEEAKASPLLQKAPVNIKVVPSAIKTKEPALTEMEILDQVLNTDEEPSKRPSTIADEALQTKNEENVSDNKETDSVVNDSDDQTLDIEMKNENTAEPPKTSLINSENSENIGEMSEKNTLHDIKNSNQKTDITNKKLETNNTQTTKFDEFDFEVNAENSDTTSKKVIEGQNDMTLPNDSINKEINDIFLPPLDVNPIADSDPFSPSRKTEQTEDQSTVEDFSSLMPEVRTPDESSIIDMIKAFIFNDPLTNRGSEKSHRTAPDTQELINVLSRQSDNLHQRYEPPDESFDVYDYGFPVERDQSIYNSPVEQLDEENKLQTRKGLVGKEPPPRQTISSRREDTPVHYAGDAPFFIKIPGSPNAVPVFLQYEPVKVNYVPASEMNRNRGQNLQPKNSQGSQNRKTEQINDVSDEDSQTVFIPEGIDPFFIMEAPNLANKDSSMEKENDVVLDNKDISVDVGGSLNLGNRKTSINMPGKEEILYPGEALDGIHPQVNTDNLSNPVFSLGSPVTSTTVDMNPQYTPFPLTTNPPMAQKTKQRLVTPSMNPNITTTRPPASTIYAPVPSTKFDPNTQRDNSSSENTLNEGLTPAALKSDPLLSKDSKIPNDEFDIVALANFLHQNQKVWSNQEPISPSLAGTWRGTNWDTIKYGSDVKEPKWQDPISSWQQLGVGNERGYSAFYSPEEIPGWDPNTFTYNKIFPSSREPRNNELDIDALKQYILSLPMPIQKAIISPTEEKRSKRHVFLGEHIKCDWNIKSDPGLFLIVTFHNLSASYSVDCTGAYIEVERENNGFDARWCGNRVAMDGSRSHVIFAKSEVRISVFDDGSGTKVHPTGFEADVEAVDLFDRADHNNLALSNARSKMRRLVEIK